MSTPVETWAPAFAWLARIEPETTQGPFRDGKVWCNLCETPVPLQDKLSHARAHARERTEYRRRQHRSVTRENTQRLRQLNRLKRETREATR